MANNCWECFHRTHHLESRFTNVSGQRISEIHHNNPTAYHLSKRILRWSSFTFFGQKVVNQYLLTSKYQQFAWQIYILGCSVFMLWRLFKYFSFYWFSWKARESKKIKSFRGRDQSSDSALVLHSPAWCIFWSWSWLAWWWWSWWL